MDPCSVVLILRADTNGGDHFVVDDAERGGDDNSDDRGFKLLPKKMAKRYVGHSPDFFESWLYIMIFSLTKKKHKKIKGLWML